MNWCVISDGFYISRANFKVLFFQVHRGIKGVVRDKDTEGGIAGAVIKVDDIDHHVRSGTVHPLYVHVAAADTSIE